MPEGSGHAGDLVCPQRRWQSGLKTGKDRFLVELGLLSVIDSDGIELIQPVREGRSPQQIGKKGISNHRWIVGGKLCFLLNHLGLVVGWDCATDYVHDSR
jgi:hypothetical protein